MIFGHSAKDSLHIQVVIKYTLNIVMNVLKWHLGEQLKSWMRQNIDIHMTFHMSCGKSGFLWITGLINYLTDTLNGIKKT